LTGKRGLPGRVFVCWPSKHDAHFPEVRTFRQIPQRLDGLSNGNVRSITGRRPLLAIARFMASNMSRLPTLMPCSRMRF